MFLSVFDIFKVGPGPSSSHTMGPMVAARTFLDLVATAPGPIDRLQATLHGSLAFTGKGHESDRAVVLGLAGFAPESYEKGPADAALAEIARTRRLRCGKHGPVRFDPATDLRFDFDTPLPLHPNGLTFRALAADGDVLMERQYYSVGGGFIATPEELAVESSAAAAPGDEPYPFESAARMLELCRETGKSIAEIALENECAHRPRQEVEAGISRIWNVMEECISRGTGTDGVLPGGLKVKRRAAALHRKLTEQVSCNTNLPESHSDWLIAYAMAVNEENAAGGRVVTAPTNGAAGVIPAVICYWQRHMQRISDRSIQDFFLTATAIGGLIKQNASISGAECGCQAEVGSAAAMAAAGLTSVRGGSPAQIENAAEIALEHHLGMTCDPIRGLVQVPCIERNGLGAIKALAASSLALHGDGTHLVQLDDVIETMWQTGQDMHSSYKETSLGGLAVNVPNC